tara:strand:+ start:1066 stop:1383 length:318 start_codon:yes stop_codon:yes gene_type:complete
VVGNQLERFEGFIDGGPLQCYDRVHLVNKGVDDGKDGGLREVHPVVQFSVVEEHVVGYAEVAPLSFEETARIALDAGSVGLGCGVGCFLNHGSIIPHLAQKYIKK